MDVVIYARVSTGKQVENDLSIPDQLRQLREWCKSHHHRLVSEYVEAGATATMAMARCGLAVTQESKLNG